MKTKPRSLGLVAAEGIISNLMFGSLFVWSVLRNPFLEMFSDWNEGMLSFIFGIHNLFVCLGILLSGRLLGRFGARRLYALFALMTALGMGGFALLQAQRPYLSFALAFVFFCFFTAAGVGIGIGTVQSSTIPWFPRRSGTISGALYMALGTSSVLLAAAAERLLPAVGVKYVFPVFGAAILAVAALVLCDPRSMTPPQTTETADSGEGQSPREMLRSGTFRRLLIWNVALRTAGLTLLDHNASMAEFYGGAVLVSMLIAPANGLGSIAVGAAFDRLGRRRIFVSAAFLMLIAGALLCFGTVNGLFALIFCGLLLGGFAYGGSSSTYAASVKNCFGSKYYTQNFAVSNIAMGCAALLESVSGTLLDASGTYTSVMLMVTALAATALTCALTERAG